MHDRPEAIATGLCCGLPIFVFYGYLVITQFDFYWRRVPQALDHWAKENGHRLIRKEQRAFRTGPFSFRVGCVVYRVQVQDAGGVVKDGWVLIGRRFWYNVAWIEVEWDRPRPPPVLDDQQPTGGNPLMWDRELDT